jgi:carboxyl-terminal processing protease
MNKTIKIKFVIASFLVFALVTAGVFTPIIIGYQNQISELEDDLDKKDNIVIKNPTLPEGEEFEKFLDVYELLINKHRQKSTTQELLDGAIEGMISALDDPYTNYMNVEEAEQFASQMEGEYQGIGAGLYEENGRVIIEYTFKDSPAEKSGVLAGDVIVEVDGVDVREFNSAEIVGVVRGDAGTEVTIGFERPGVAEIVYIVIIRDTIPLLSVEHRMLDVEGQNIGYVEISRVGEKTYLELVDALSDLGDVDSLVVDVRGNPGGYLHIIQQITNLFVGDDLPYIQIEDRNGNVESYYVSSSKLEMPVVVLINENSASAAEIFAAALNQIEDIPLVGVTTFGKGTVQTQNKFDDGSSIKYTIQKFLSPNGEWFHGIGVSPTHEVIQPEFYNFYKVSILDEISENIYNQQVLNAERVLDVLGYNIVVDGFLDDNTMDEIATFQEDHELTVTSSLTLETASKLNTLMKAIIEDESNDAQLQKAIELLTE